MKRHFALLLASLLVVCAVSAQEYRPVPVTVSTEKVKLNGKVYYSHTVLERQTLYGIAKAYNVTEEDLYQANPTLRETGLQKNAILLVPVAGTQESLADEPREDTPQGPAYIEHTVRWFEDIDDIARKYKVTVQQIMDFNQLQSRKLSARQVLRIPMAPFELPQTDTTAVVPETPVPQETPEQTDSTLFYHNRRSHVEFSLLLPLQAGSGGSELNMDFYSGVLMALKDLESEGLQVKMHVYDLSAGLPDTQALCQSDFVLGPVAAKDLETVLSRTEGRVPVISPLDQKAAALCSTYNNFIQVPSGADNQYEDLGQWVQEDCQYGDKIIFISEKDAASTQAPVGIRSALAARNLEYSILTYAISQGRGIPDNLLHLMVKGGVNRVVVASENEAFVGDAVRNLGIMLGKGYQVVMYAPSKVRNFDTIDGSALHDLSCHISTAYHVHYGSEAVDAFVRTYRSLFRTEPSQFAFQGYDTARYFVERVARFGFRWTRRLDQERSRGLHTDFVFDTDEGGNHHNVAVRRIVYQEDYTTVLLQ